MSTDVIQLLSQFGAAGLVGALWIWERRLTARRERELGEAHARILEQRCQLDELLRVIAENTRAISSMETCQRGLGTLLEETRRRLDPSDRAV